MAPQPPPQPEAWEKIGKNWRGPAEKFWRYKHMYVYMYIIDKYVNIYIYNYVYVYIYIYKMMILFISKKQVFFWCNLIQYS